MAATDFFGTRKNGVGGLRSRRDSIHTFKGASIDSVVLLFKSVLGMMFFIAAVGLWLVPGALAVPEAMLMQFAVTGLFLTLGVVLFRGSSAAQKPELHIDLVRRTVELGVSDSAGLNVSIARYQMDELSDIAVLGTTVVATDLAGNRVISLDLDSKKAATELREFLIEMPPLSNTTNVFLDPEEAY